MSLVVLKVRVNFGFETWMFQPKKQPHFESFSSFQSISLWIYGDTIWLITRHYLFSSMDSEWIHRHFRSESDSCALMIRRANNSIPLISIIIIIREYQRWLLFAFSFLHQFSIFNFRHKELSSVLNPVRCLIEKISHFLLSLFIGNRIFFGLIFRRIWKNNHEDSFRLMVMMMQKNRETQNSEVGEKITQIWY